MKRKRMWIIVAIVAVGSLIAAIGFFNNNNSYGQQVERVAQTIQPGQLTGQPVTFDIFRKIADRMNKTVVNIYTTQIVEGINPFGDLFGNDPMFRRFFGDIPEEPQRQNALGSGVIIDSSGLILTNNHVIEKADEIRVSLQNQPVSDRGFEAKVVGRDPQTDLALIQIQPDAPLTAAPLGNSDQLQIGDWVIAIGNPFNLGHTVTVGVVSAKGRALGGPYDDFIQTDASINPGNSGGPLLNWHGEVVGINSAIASRTGQSAGIGFAVPVNIAKEIVPQLRATGKVVRGQLGVTIQSNWNEDLAKQFGVNQGAIVTSVTEGSAAEQAGIRRGDVIVEYNGQPVREGRDLSRLVAATKPGTTVRIKVIRDRKEMNITARVQELRQTETDMQPGIERQSGMLGLSVTNIDPSMAEQLKLETQEGVIVTGVEIGSPAERAGLQRGDVILEVGGQRVSNVNQLRGLISNARGDSILFLIHRGGGTLFVAVPLQENGNNN